jgi:hypothetical protein
MGNFVLQIGPYSFLYLHKGPWGNLFTLLLYFFSPLASLSYPFLPAAALSKFLFPSFFSLCSSPIWPPPSFTGVCFYFSLSPVYTLIQPNSTGSSSMRLPGGACGSAGGAWLAGRHRRAGRWGGGRSRQRAARGCGQARAHARAGRRRAERARAAEAGRPAAGGRRLGWALRESES